MVKRQRLPKNDVGDHWEWRDLNNGVNITVYGKVFHLYACDKFTTVSISTKYGYINVYIALYNNY